MSVHDQLVELCDTHIQRYRNDLLVHDKSEIERNPGIPFLHWTRESGTSLAMMHPTHNLPASGEIVPILFGEGGRDILVRNVVEMAEYHNRDNRISLTLYCDGEKFYVCSPATAYLIAIAYQKHLQVEWSAELALI